MGLIYKSGAFRVECQPSLGENSSRTRPIAGCLHVYNDSAIGGGTGGAVDDERSGVAGWTRGNFIYNPRTSSVSACLGTTSAAPYHLLSNAAPFGSSLQLH